MNCWTPPVVRRTVGSLWGIRDALGYSLWPRSPKKSRNRRRISLLCMRPIRGQFADLALMFQVLQFDPQVLQRAPEEAGDVHLADADVVRDLGLRLALVEAELQDLLLLILDALDGLLEQDPVLQPFYRGLIVGLEVHDRVPLRLILAYGRVEAGRVVSPPERQRLRHTLHVGVEGLGEFLQRGRPTRPHGLVADCFLRRLAELLQATGDPHRPALVTEVTFDLTEDVRGRVGGELDLPVYIEAVHRLYQADGGDLDQIVQGLTAACELAGQELGQGKLFLDDPLACVLVVVLVVAHEQAARARFVRSAIAPAHETSSTTVRQLVSVLPPVAGSSTSARTPSPAREKRKRVGASSA